MLPQSERSDYDVVIVGGGVSGAVVARKMSQAGKRVLVLEAGISDALDPANYRSYLSKFYTMGAGRSAPNGPYPVNPDALSPNDSRTDPYYLQQGPRQFLSDYLRMLGGTTLHWQGTSVRMLPNDFRMQSVYGQALDWPISYDDLEPSYREAEQEIGVSANVADQANLGVWFADGYVYPMQKMPQSVIDQFLDSKLTGATVDLFGGTYPLRVVSMPVARNSTPNAAFNNGEGYVPVSAIGDRDSGNRCQGNSSCTPLCPVQAKYNALKTLMAATRQGGVEVRSQSVASKLIIDPISGRIAGVEYKRYAAPEQAAYETETAYGTIVVLAANAIENAVLMLASDVDDRSGQLGRNLMDHPYLNFFGLAPCPVYPFRGPDTTSGVESLRDGKFREKHASIRSGIGNWGWGGQPAGMVASLLSQKHFGPGFRQQLRETLTRMVKLGMMIEQLPDPSNRVTIDPGHKDQLGNYLPVLNYSYADYTLDGAVAAIGTVWPTIVERAGIEDKTDPTNPPAGTQMVTHNGKTFSLAGSGHLVGTHRMGRSAEDSVVDHNLRSWTHKNLYVVGTGSMVTIGTSNPTLTAAALCFRAADHILQELN